MSLEAVCFFLHTKRELGKMSLLLLRSPAEEHKVLSYTTSLIFFVMGEFVTVSFSNTGHGMRVRTYSGSLYHSSKVICFFCCLVLGERRETLKWLRFFWFVSFRWVWERQLLSTVGVLWHSIKWVFPCESWSLIIKYMDCRRRLLFTSNKHEARHVHGPLGRVQTHNRYCFSRSTVIRTSSIIIRLARCGSKEEVRNKWIKSSSTKPTNKKKKR